MSEKNETGSAWSTLGQVFKWGLVGFLIVIGLQQISSDDEPRAGGEDQSMLKQMVSPSDEKAKDDAPPPISDLTPRDVLSRLTDRYTEAQRESWFNANADDKRVRWQMRLTDVSEGWFHFDVRGRVWGGNDVVCRVDINEQTRQVTLNLRKGQTVTCEGRLFSYSKFGDTHLYVNDASVR